MNRLAPDRAAGFLPRIEPAPLAPSRSLGLLTAAAGRTVLPLGAVEIKAKVAARIASVSLVQTFRNASDDALEALYVFPLPGGAAISSLEMAVGDRVIRAAIQERKAARASYERAVDQGHRGALLEQERDGVFTMSVGNVAPGESVAVRLTYVERLPSFDDGRTELRLPLVVAPRYIPGSAIDRVDEGQGVESDTDVVADASRISPPRLAPGLDPDVALSVEVELSSGSEGADPVDDIECSQHATRLSGGSFGIRIALAREGERLDRDFVLRWRAAPEKAQASLLCVRGPDGARYGMITLAAPRAERVKAAARDVVLLLDVSPSMAGAKLASAVRSGAFLIESLGPDDRFEVVLFSSTSLCMNGALIAADEAGIAKAGRFLRNAQLGNGTELDPALERGLSILNTRGFAAEERLGVLLVVTDGEVGDEERILARLKKGRKRSRLFAVGIDTAVNASFLQRLAKIGDGSATLVEPGAKVEDALRAFSREIGSPFASDLVLEDQGAGIEAVSLAPERLPDLFSGRAASAFVRLSARQGGRVRVRGKLASGGAFDASAEAREIDLPAIALLWAKARVQDLEDRGRLLERKGRAVLEKEITALAVAHGLVTPFTSFVAVDTAEVVKGAMGRRTVVQPVEKPAGWQGEAAMPCSAPCAPCSPAARPAPAPAGAPILGSVVGGFRVTKQLGEGGMGVVYLGVVDAESAGSAPPPPPPGAPPLPPAGAPPGQAGPGGYGGFGGSMSGGPALTAAGMTLGTVVYMPPEQLMGRDLGPTADVYAAGVVLFEVTTGRLPFYHDNEMQLMKMIMKDSPPRPSAINPAIPPALEAVILRALEKDPARRFSTAPDMAAALALAGERMGMARGGSVGDIDDDRGAPVQQSLPADAPREIGGYRLEGLIDEDGFGRLYAATQIEGGQPVHLFQTYPSLMKAESIRSRFRREAAAATRLSHPNLARVLGLIETPESLFFLLEPVEGVTLEALVEDLGFVSPDLAIAIMVPVLHALGALHGARLLHRNLTPAHIAVSYAGEVKVFTLGSPVRRGARPFTRPIAPPQLEESAAGEGTLWRRVVGLFTRGTRGRSDGV